MKRRLPLKLALGLAVAWGLTGAAMAQDQPYIPLISKGFQHQFWQAVKSGAEKAAKDYNVKVSFEGPETEAMVDKQIDMLSAALAKSPKAIGFAALDSKAAIPLLKKAQAGKIPVIAFGYCDDVEPPVAPTVTSRRLASSIVLMPEACHAAVVSSVSGWTSPRNAPHFWQ